MAAGGEATRALAAIHPAIHPPLRGQVAAGSGAESDAASASGDADLIVATLRGTLLDAWEAFLAHLPFLVAGGVVLLVTWLAVALFRRFSTRLIGRLRVRRSLRDLLERLATIGIWLLGLLLASMVAFPGLTPTRALGALGVVSIAVGFAFRDIFENFFAGILILWRFPFENGDYIECEGITGRVEETTVRNTLIRQVTGELVVVPNGVLFKNPVQVLTDRAKRRLTVMTGIAYGEQVDEALPVIRRAVEACGTVDDGHPVEIFPHGFGSSSIDIEVTWWTDPTPLDLRRSRGEVVAAVKRGLDEAGIEIPFPYRTLTFKEPLPLRGSEPGSDAG